MSSDKDAEARSEETNLKDKAYKICRDFLGGTWKNISSSDMIFRPIVGGFSNLLYYCSLPETCEAVAGEPNRVLFRKYGELQKGLADIVVTESVIFMMLSERKLGPKLHGVFPGGRLEEYIPSRTLTIEEERDPKISSQIARKLAKFHMLRVPINKEPSTFFDNMLPMLDYIRNNVKLESMEDERRALAEKFISVDLEGEIAWLRSFMLSVESPVVFAHNDLSRGNLLLPDDPEGTSDDLVFIDYEFSCYNYRGYELAMHFCEWSYDYFFPEYPYFAHSTSRYPTMNQQLTFMRAYLDGLDPPVTQEESMRGQRTDTVSHLLQEYNVFVLACQMICAIWGVFQSHKSKIKFGYLEYGVCRLTEYFRWKEHLLSASSTKDVPNM